MQRSMWVGVCVGVLLLMTGSAVTANTDPNPNSQAQIAVAFSADCTDFAVDSSKDVSFVETHFAGGAVVKDESMTSPEYAYAGDDAIALVVVKSGTTTATFACEAGEPDHGQD